MTISNEELGAMIREQMRMSGPIHTVSGKDVYGLLTAAVPRGAGIEAAIQASVDAFNKWKGNG